MHYLSSLKVTSSVESEIWDLQHQLTEIAVGSSAWPPCHFEFLSPDKDENYMLALFQFDYVRDVSSLDPENSLTMDVSLCDSEGILLNDILVKVDKLMDNSLKNSIELLAAETILNASGGKKKDPSSLLPSTFSAPIAKVSAAKKYSMRVLGKDGVRIPACHSPMVLIDRLLYYRRWKERNCHKHKQSRIRRT